MFHEVSKKMNSEFSVATWWTFIKCDIMEQGYPNTYMDADFLRYGQS